MIEHNVAKLESNVINVNFDLYDPKSDSIKKHNLEEFEGKWLVLFFYPADFTFVCPTELRDLNNVREEFEEHNAEVLVVSTDTVFSHKKWIETEKLLEGFCVKMVSDRKAHLCKYFNCYNGQTGNSERASFIISPDGIVKSIEIVTEPIGRSSFELVRKLKALEFLRNNPGHACPASWNTGGVTLQPSIKMAGDVASHM